MMWCVPYWLSKCVSEVTFGAVKFGWWSTAYESDVSPIIIGGSPRTGSTLLRVMLDNHPDIWIGPENGVFQEGGKNIPGMQACLGLSEATLRSLLRRSTCLGEFVERTMYEASKITGKMRWGIKSPSVVHTLSTVFHFFPQAKFIHIVRDGRDVACSLRTHPKYRWIDGKAVPTGIVNPWSDCVAQWLKSTMAALKWRHNSQYYELRYEDLIKSPESVIRTCLSWLGHEFDKRVLQYYERQVNEGIDSPHPGIRQPVTEQALRRWRYDLTREGCAAFTPAACALLVELGYASDEDGWKNECDFSAQRL